MSSEERRTTIEAPQNGQIRSEPQTSPAAVPAAPETRGERFGRKARRTRLHLYAGLSVALLVCLVALVVANTRQVKLSWVVGTSTASLVWIVLASAVLGWLLGVFSSALFRWRTRARRT
jgi:uncharacterized integral membrane protein